MKPIVLCIMDGVGINEATRGNAFKNAETPNFDYLVQHYPNSLLEASGQAVGLPNGQMGNSEVGHMNMGAGRIVYQPLELINRKIEDKSFFENKEIKEVINHTKENNSKLHILGLLSDGGIHSHINHLFALLKMCKENGVNEVCLHMFLDGRDTAPNSSLKFLDELKRKIDELGIGKISTLSGRYYAMDRDNRWDRIEKAYKAVVLGIGEEFDNYTDAINKNYENNITDEFIVPAVLDKDSKIEENDGLIVFNYRPDRLRELFKAITNPDFNDFERKYISNLKLVTMMPVSDEVIYKNAFNIENLKNTLGEYLSKKGINQLRIAETEKYAHVTYFFDGGMEKKIKKCRKILIPSPKVETYDMQPEMSAYEITDRLIEELDKDMYDVVILNYANGDMVGHTGNFEKTVEAVEVLDKCLGKLYKKVLEKKGILVVTADHGNCDYMLDRENKPVTSHSKNKVPCIITDKKYKLSDGKLADIAPTILKLIGLEIPEEMTGNVLIKDYTIEKRLENLFDSKTEPEDELIYYSAKYEQASKSGEQKLANYYLKLAKIAKNRIENK